MSDRSVEDEFISEARKFSASMQAAMRHYAQASNWLERRRARREISLITRQEAREQLAARQRHLGYTETAVDRYRAHALAVNQRANDPTVDHDRRFRDAQALARHRNDMTERVLRNPHLTQVEQGIALDGLDAATVFPEFKTNGRLFNRANKVKGIEALRYRAQVAREMRTAGIERPAMFTAPARDRGERLPFGDPGRNGRPGAARGANIEEEAVSPPWGTGRTAQLRDTDWETTVRFHGAGREPRADDVSVLSGQHADRENAARWARETVADLKIAPNTTVSVAARQGGEDVPTYIASGTPEQVMEEIDERWHSDGLFRSAVTYLPENANQVVYETAAHPSEAEAAKWTRQQLDTIRPAPGTTIEIAAYQGDDERDPKQVFRSEGARGVLAQEVEQWQAGIEARNTSTSPVQPQQRASSTAETERDRELASLKDRHRLSIQYNNQLVGRNAELVKNLTASTAERDELAQQLATLTAERDQWRDEYAKDTADEARLEAERSQLRETNSRLTAKLDQALAERDQLRAERDAAVRKVAERTPAEQRYGSPERQAAQVRREATEELVDGLKGGRERINQELADKEAEEKRAAELREQIRRGMEAHAEYCARQDAARDEVFRAAGASQEELETIQALQDAPAVHAQATATESAPRSPLADYQPGHALADAVARNGHDREAGMER
ncbi:hypothetical protein [Nocardia vinacea]|uniref:hypothetical protein n=1 Tax=Nocardia vinacea TaxID=96468 RepID=UPI0002E41026|nr:hypothetical protein [Nocardia vinacea]